MNTYPTEEEIAEAKALAKGRDIHLVTVDITGEDFYAIVMAPAKPDYNRFLQKIKDADALTQMKAQEQLVKESTLWPDDAELLKHFDSKIRLSSKIAEELMKLAGSEAAVTVKKL